jgi:inorganic pyrophosphatase
MTTEQGDQLWQMLGLLLRAHPWHGVYIGAEAPDKLTSYIEIVPTDTVKYELDKQSGILRIDRPQRYSSYCPTLYGLIPQTYCGERVGAYCAKQTGQFDIKGDGDPLDICVLSEKEILHGDILLQAIPIGGLRMIDGEEADDKIIAVLENDVAFHGWANISDLPEPMLDRLRHYFLTYKDVPGSHRTRVRIADVYDRAEAHEVIRRSQEDYQAIYGNISSLLSKVRRD